MEKACEKKKKLDKQKVDGSGSTTPPGDPGVAGSQDNDMPDASAGARAKGETSEDSPGNSSKRKRHDETSVSTPMDGEDESPFKRLKSTDVDTPPPPPPPPPPADSTTFDEQGDAIDDADTPDAFQQAALDSFENESFEPPIRYATVRGAQAKNEIGVQVNRAVKAELGDVSGANGHPSPMQLATPSTNDSYDNFDGMHSDRLRHLGVANGR